MPKQKHSDCKLYELDVGECKYIKLPLCVVIDARLTPLQKTLYGLIQSLSQKTGWCTMSNNSFAVLLNVARENIAKSISGLEKYGFIKREAINQGSGNNYTGRRVRCNEKVICMLPKGSDEKITTLVTKKSLGSDENVTGGSDENVTQYYKTDIKNKYNLNNNDTKGKTDGRNWKNDRLNDNTVEPYAGETIL